MESCLWRSAGSTPAHSQSRGFNACAAAWSRHSGCFFAASLSKRSLFTWTARSSRASSGGSATRAAPSRSAFFEWRTTRGLSNEHITSAVELKGESQLLARMQRK